MSAYLYEGNTGEGGQSEQATMDALHLPLIHRPLQTNQMISTTPAILPNGLTTQFPNNNFAPHQLPHQHVQQQHLRRPDHLQIFWASQLQEIRCTTDFKNHNLPLARIKKIMKADEDVKMIAAETPVLFSRACEMFILELSYHSWAQTEHSKRRTMQKSDIAASIAKRQVFDFLVDIVPVDEIKSGLSSIPGSEELNESIPYFYDSSKFGSLMMDIRHSDMDSQGSTYIKQHQDSISQQTQEPQNYCDKNIDWC